MSWDKFEETMSHMLGDIAAHRIIQLLHHCSRLPTQTSDRLLDNLGEYLVHEQKQLVTQSEMSRFVQDVHALEEELTALERRCFNEEF